MRGSAWLALRVHGVEPHLQSHGRLAGGVHEQGGVVAGFSDGGVLPAGAIEHAVAAVTEAAALRVEMGEGRHDAGAAGAEQPLAGRDQADLADFVADAVVGHGFQRIQRVEVLRAGHALEQADRGKAAGDDAVGGAPRQARGRIAQAQPPRRASRYWRTARRSATLPPSMRSSALLPPNRGAVLGFFTQASADVAAGNRTCSAL